MQAEEEEEVLDMIEEEAEAGTATENQLH